MILLSNFALGLILGSFLNVVIYRLNPAFQPKGGVFGKRSVCPNCQTILKWHDLFPVFSFLFLRGRCRYCRKKISWQYPIVEVISGLIWVGIFYKIFGVDFSVSGASLTRGQLLDLLDFIYYIFIFSAFLIIAVYDFKWRIILDEVIYPAIVAAFVYDALSYFKSGNYDSFVTAVIIASVVFLFFFLIYHFSNGHAMGFGDAKMAFLIGLFLNPIMAAIAFNAAFILGAICGIILLAFGNKTLKSQIAFGPFLAIGTAVAFFISSFINNFTIF